MWSSTTARDEDLTSYRNDESCLIHDGSRRRSYELSKRRKLPYFKMQDIHEWIVFRHLQTISFGRSDMSSEENRMEEGKDLPPPTPMQGVVGSNASTISSGRTNKLLPLFLGAVPLVIDRTWDRWFTHQVRREKITTIIEEIRLPIQFNLPIANFVFYPRQMLED